MHNKQQFNYIIGLDLLRFFAAFLVMMYHLGFYVWKGGYLQSLSVDFGVLAPFASVGWIGVEIFFTISGFVIVFSASKSNSWQFFRGRVLRLVPAAWLCASVTALFMILDGFTKTYVLGLLVKAAVFWPFATFIDASYWTLGVELFFYTLVLISLVSRKVVSTETIVVTIGLIGSLFWFSTFITENLYLLKFAQFDKRSPQLALQFNTFFAIGSLVYYLTHSGITKIRLLLGLVFISANSIEIYYRCVAAAYWPMPIRFDSKISFWTFMIPESLWVSSLILITISVSANTLLKKHLSGYLHYIRLVGLMTYPLYLIHQQVGYILMKRPMPWIGSWLSLCCAMAFSLGVAFVVASVAEPRLRRFIASLIDGWSPARKTSSA